MPRKVGYVRQLESGLWAATMHTPAGRVTETFDLVTQARDWCGTIANQKREGTFIDPRLAKRHLSEAWEKYGSARRVEKPTRAREASQWKVHVQPRWGHVPVGAIAKPDVQTWINAMEDGGIGGWTIIGAANVLKAALELAVDAGWIKVNAARRVKLPLPPEHEDRVLDADEEATILRRLDELFPGRRDARLFVETLLETGARWEEAAGIRKEAIVLRTGLINLGPVMERDGTVRDYPKAAKSRQSAGFRPAPIGPGLLARLRPVLLATPAKGLVFTAPEGGSLRYSTWLDRVWNVAVVGTPERVLKHAPRGAFDEDAFVEWLDREKARCGFGTDKELAAAAGIDRSLLSNWRRGKFGPSQERARRLARALEVPESEVFRRVGLVVAGVPGAGLADPQPTPHDCRHTFGTRLAEHGVELHHRMALMGHADHRSSGRYAHSGDSRFDKAREALAAARGARTG